MTIKNGNDVLSLRKLKYASDNKLAIVSTDQYGEPYATLTVNLVDEHIGEDEAFLDTNNCPWVEEKLKKANIITEPVRYARSGYCTYPLYKIKL